MPVSVLVPTRIRVDTVGLTKRRDVIAEALASAARRAFASSRDVALVPRGGYAGIRLCTPTITWTGAGLGRVSAVVRAEMEALVRATFSRAAVDARLYDFARAAAPAPPVLPDAIRELVEGGRFALDGDGYVIPSYQPKKGGTTTIVRVKQARPIGSFSDQELKRIQAVVAQLVKDDVKLFQQVLSGTRTRPGRSPADPVNVEILRVFATRAPSKFRKLLLDASLGGAATIARVYEVSEGEIKRVTKDPQAIKEAARYLDIAADALHLAGELPEAAWLAEELERRMPGFRRIVGMLYSFASARRELLDYLITAEDKTDKGILQDLDRFDLWRYPALLAALASGKPDVSTFRPQQELLAYYKALVGALSKLREIDTLLLLFRLTAGPGADKLEEVEALLESRARYLSLLIDVQPASPFRKDPIDTLLKNADAYYADWRGRATDKRLQHVAAAIKELTGQLSSISIYPAGMGRDNAYSEFNTKLFELRGKVSVLASEVANAGKQGEARRRGEFYHSMPEKFLQRLEEPQVQRSLITFWNAALHLPKWAFDHDIGDADDRSHWLKLSDTIIGEVRREWPRRYFISLPDQQKWWQQLLDALLKEINEKAEAEVKRQKRKFWLRLAITVVAMVLTRGVVGFAGGRLGLSAAQVTLIGAGTFTAVTTIGQIDILREEVRARDVLLSFSENATFGFLFGWLNVRFISFGRYLAPGRDLAQLTIVLGTDAVVGGAVNVALTLVRTGNLPDDMQAFVLSSVVLAATGAMLGSPRLRQQLRTLNIQDELRGRFDRLDTEGAAFFEHMRKIGAGGPDDGQHEALKQRALRMSSDVEHVLGRLAGKEFSPATLAALGLSRSRVDTLKAIVAQYAEVIRKSQPPSGGGRSLPKPSQVVPDLAKVGPDAFEYNQYLPARSPDEMMVLFRRSGYDVVDTGGGVLRLTGAGMNRPLLLLPSRPSVPPPSLETIVGGYDVAAQRRALHTLQAQPDMDKYVAQLTTVAKTSQLTAQQLLRAIGRFLGPQHATELRGFRRFLEHGGNPKTLAKLLSPAETGEWFIDVQKALRTLGSFSPQANEGLRVFFDLRSGITASNALRVFHNFEPQQVVGIFESLQRLAPRSSNLGGLIPDLTGNVPQKQKAVIGVLLSANKDLDRLSDAHLVFEDPSLSAGGEVRVSDYRVFRPGAGLSRRVEVKEVYRLRSLADDAVRRQLAINIVIEVEERRTLAGRSRPFESIDWRIRRQEIAAEAARRLKIPDVNDPAVKRQIIEDVKGQLRPALDHPVIKRALASGAITEAELAEYRKAFEAALPFVTFN